MGRVQGEVAVGKGIGSRWGRRVIVAGAVSGVAALAAGVAVYAAVIEPRRIVVDRVCLAIHDLAPQLDGLTLVQLSDLHCGPSRRWPTHLRRAVRIANELRPDLIVLTGDFADDTSIVPQCAAILSELRAPRGVVAVFGNHDYYGSPRRPHVLLEALRHAGIVVLRNEVYEVATRAPLQIVGLDDAYSGHDKLTLALERLPRHRGVCIMLSHYPDVVERLAPGTVDLMLSGHAHGGQIRLPLLTHLVRRYHVHTSYSHGMYDVDGVRLYVNRGLGSSFPQVRLFSPPEVTHFTLTRDP